MSVDLEYDVESLIKFVKKHSVPPLFAFYGGEPLIRWEKMREIIDALPTSKFALQTNGTLLRKISPEYIGKFYTILLSVDGSKETTDNYRGEGVYDRVMKGAQYLKQSKYGGELIARMTVSVNADIYSDVRNLIDTGYFDVIHWQLNTLWDIPEGNEIAEFKEWIETSYNPGITRLIRWWVDELEDGRFHLIAPFAGILYSILTDESVGLRCGAGSDFFAITTEGRITACPIPPSLVFPILGNINESIPDELPNQLNLINPCTSCSYRSLCGGRCLYTNLTKHWGMDGFKIVCRTSKHLIDELKKIVPRIRELIKSGIVTVESLKYPKVPNGVEVIP